jgi:hypothetical protein
LLILIDGATLPFCAPGLLPRLGPPEDDLSAALRGAFLDHNYRRVIYSGNDCSKLQHAAK